MNQIDEEENKEIVEKKKGIAWKTSSRSEELYEDSYEDEDAEMAMLARRYKKLSFQCDQRMGKKALEEIDLGISHQKTIK